MNRLVLLNPRSYLVRTNEPSEYNVLKQIDANADIKEIREVMQANFQTYSSEIFHLPLTKKELECASSRAHNLVVLCSHGLLDQTFMFDEHESIVAQSVTASEISEILKQARIHMLIILACHSKPIADAIRNQPEANIDVIICIDSHERVADDVTPHFLRHLLGGILKNDGHFNEAIFKDTVQAMSALPHLSRERQQHQLSKFVYNCKKQQQQQQQNDSSNILIFKQSKINGFSMNDDWKEDELVEKAKIQKFFIGFMLSSSSSAHGKVTNNNNNNNKLDSSSCVFAYSTSQPQEGGIRSLSQVDLQTILHNDGMIAVIWTIRTLRAWWQHDLLLGFDAGVHEFVLNDKSFVSGDCILRLSSKSENAKKIVLVYYNSKRDHTNIYLNVCDDGLIEIAYQDGTKKKYSSLLHALLSGTQPPIERVCFVGRDGGVEKKNFEEIEALFQQPR